MKKIINHLKTTKPDSALIVEGGAMRSVFSAGILDGFLIRGFNPFEMYLGVSAGATNLAAYLAGEPGKSVEIYTDFALRKEFISKRRFLLGGHFIDLEWLSQELFYSGYIDLPAVYGNNKPFYVVVTDVETGHAEYIKTSENNLKQSIKASASLPLLSRKFFCIEGKMYTDGGVADGIPIGGAIAQGAKNIMIIRSRHKEYMKKDSLFHRYIRWKLRGYKQLSNTMKKRVILYAQSIDLIRNPPLGVSVVEICPPLNFNVGRFCRDPVKLQYGYSMGLGYAEKAIQSWHEACNQQFK